MLAWGRRYAMIRPDHFRVDYAINPFMDPRRQPDADRARTQWQDLTAALRRAGARIDIGRQLPAAPDMVYAMNLGLATVRNGRLDVVLSHMRYEQRRVETPAARAWFTGLGASTVDVGADGVGPHFEAGDAFPWDGDLVVGFGPRTEELALKSLAAELGVRVRGYRLVHPGMYHLDLAFCPLDERRALVCPAAFDPAGAEALLRTVPEPLVLSEAEAMTFCANSVVVGRTVVMPACPSRVRRRLEEWGFEVVLVDVGELHRGGGSVRCLTNPLDITIGRDLEATTRPSVAVA